MSNIMDFFSFLKEVFQKMCIAFLPSFSLHNTKVNYWHAGDDEISHKTRQSITN